MNLYRISLLGIGLFAIASSQAMEPEVTFGTITNKSAQSIVVTVDNKKVAVLNLNESISLLGTSIPSVRLTEEGVTGYVLSPILVSDAKIGNKIGQVEVSIVPPQEGAIGHDCQINYDTIDEMNKESGGGMLFKRCNQKSMKYIINLTIERRFAYSKIDATDSCNQS